jgi:predicted nucleotidyltransferase
MGGHMNIGEALFSGVQQRLLALLFTQVDRSFYANELIRLAQIGSGAVQRELARLEAAELVVVSRVGNQKHYQANRDSPVFAELHGLVVKSFGVADVLRQVLEPLRERMQSAWLFGSMASGEENSRSDIDVFVIAADIAYPELIEALSIAETRLGRAINPVLYSEAEWLRKRAEKNHFMESVLSRPMIKLLGRDDDGITGAGKSGPRGPVEKGAARRG